MLRLLPLALLLCSLTARADEPLPAWTKAAPRAESLSSGVKAFVASGVSGDSGPAEHKSAQAEEAAFQKLGGLIADWQEAALACARKESLARAVSARSGRKGLLLDFEISSEIDVSLYRVKVLDRAYEAKRIHVRLSHELPALIAGLLADSTRPQPLREAVKLCGEKAFDEISAR